MSFVFQVALDFPYLTVNQHTDSSCSNLEIIKFGTICSQYGYFLYIYICHNHYLTFR